MLLVACRGVARPAPIVLADLGHGSCQGESYIAPEPGKAARSGTKSIHVAIHWSLWHFTLKNTALSTVPCNVR